MLFSQLSFSQISESWSDVGSGIWQSTSSDGKIKILAQTNGLATISGSAIMGCSSDAYSDPTVFGDASLAVNVSGDGMVRFFFFDLASGAEVFIQNPIVHVDKVGATGNLGVNSTSIFTLVKDTWSALNSSGVRFRANETSFKANIGSVLAGDGECPNTAGGSLRLNVLGHGIEMSTALDKIGFGAPTNDEVEFVLSNLVLNPCNDGVMAGTITGLDADADGLNNDCDLDDDNDGILDSSEGKCLSEKSGVWSLAGGSASFDYGNGLRANITTTAATTFSNGAFNASGIDFWSETLANATSLEGSFNWDSTLTIDFVDDLGNPVKVDRPTLHFDRIGGRSASVQNSARITLLNGHTWSRQAGTFDFSTTATTAMDGGSGLASSGSYVAESSLKDSNGTASGSVKIDQRVSSITLQFVQTGGSGSADGIEFILSACKDRDTDTDGVPDFLDLDTDNDGIYDSDEAGHGQAHTNGVLIGSVGIDGVPDAVQVSVGADSGSVDYSLAVSNTVVDEVPDFMALDADGDGCNDVLEAGFTDNDNDGILGDISATVNAYGLVVGASVVDGYTAPTILNYRQPGQVPTIASVSDQPQSMVTNGSSTETFIIKATGNILQYQWQVNSGSGFTNIDLADTADVYTGSDTATLILAGVTATFDTYQYRVLVTDASYTCESFTSAAAILRFDDIPPSVPTVTITEDADDNGYINGTELVDDIDVTVVLPDDVFPGDILTVDGVTRTLTAEDITLGRVLYSFSDYGDGNTVTVAAFLEDASGNIGVSASDSVLVDISPPIPVLSIDDITDDNVLNVTEAGKDVDVTGTVTGDFTAGDSVFLNINDIVFTGLIDGFGFFNIPVTGGELAADSDTTFSVNFSTSDIAGNKGAAIIEKFYSVNIAPPSATLNIDDITADNTINVAEASTTLDIKGSLAGDFDTGDSVVLTVNETLYIGVVDANGIFTVPVTGSDLVADSDTEVSISFEATDGSTTTVQKVYNVDVAVPVATLEINDITADNVLNAAEADMAIDIVGTVGGDFNAGDTVTLTINGTLFIGTVDTSGIFNISVPGSALVADSDTTVAESIMVTDKAGNTGITTVEKIYQVDVTPPELTLSIDDITVDNIVNAAEAVTTVDVTGTVEGEYLAGDSVSLLIHETTYTGTVDELGIYSIAVAGSDLAEDGDTTVSGSSNTTDAAGNTGSVSEEKLYAVDLTPPTATLNIDDITSDNRINAAEAKTEIDVTGTASGEFETGNKVTVSVNGSIFTDTVDALGNFRISVPGNDLASDTDTELSISVEATDASGNMGTTTAKKIYDVDVSTPIPTLSIDDITADNSIDDTEAGSTIYVTGSVGGEFNVGDTVTLTTNGFSHTGAVDAPGSFSIPVAGSNLAADADRTIEGDIATMNTSGNRGNAIATKVYNVETEAPMSSINIDNITADNTVNAAEAVEIIDVSGSVDGDFSAGDTVRAIVNEKTFTDTVDVVGIFTIAVPGSDLATDANSSISIRLTTNDTAGNPTDIAFESVYGVDVTAPEPILSIDNITADNRVNTIEAEATIDVTGTVSGEFNYGDTVGIFLNASLYSDTVDGSGNFSIPIAGNNFVADADSTLAYTIKSIDAAGNIGEFSGNKTYAVDAALVKVPVLLNIDTDTNTVDDFITSDNSLVLYGTSAPNHTVEVFLNGQFIETVKANGSGEWIFDYSTVILADGAYTLSAVAEDSSGNKSITSGIKTLTVDTAAPTYYDRVTDNKFPILSGQERPNELMIIAIATDGSQIPEVSYTLHANEQGEWNLSTASATPNSGNFPTLNYDTSLTVFISDTAGNMRAATLLITNDRDGDGLIDDEELMIGTDPDAIDTDNDGVTDAQEILDDTNPLSDCESTVGTALGSSDCDDDGLSNAEEAAYSTDPNNPDSDNDGILDGQEIRDGTDAMNACDSKNGNPPSDAPCEVSIQNTLLIPGTQDDSLIILDIEAYPENTVRIFNRWGVVVYEMQSYDNVSKVFRGLSNGKGVVNNSESLPAGIYYYTINYSKNDNGKTKSGYLHIGKQ